MVRNKRLSPPTDYTKQPVSIIIAAHNEEHVLAEKLNSIYDSLYPSQLITVFIGNDMSTDNTQKIIDEYKAKHDNLICYGASSRHGKPALVNKLVQMAIDLNGKEQILILTDANVNFEAEMIASLVANHGIEGIGLVGANTKLKPKEMHAGISDTEQTYNERELKIKQQEGILWGTMMGPFGACFSMRADLWRPVPEDFIVDDFWTCLSVLKQGAKTILAESALAYEYVLGDAQVEYKRKVRMSIGNLQNLFFFKYMLFSPLPGLSYAYWSHKVLRWFTPILLLLAYAILWMLFDRGVELMPILIVIHAVVLLCLLDFFLEKIGIRSGPLRSVRHFLMMNIAMMNGYVKYFTGKTSSIWDPTVRK